MRNISKLILLFLTVVTSSSISSAQKTRYQRVIGGDKDDNNYSIDKTLDGGFILTGYTTSFGAGGEDAYLIKTNALGAVEWTKSYGNTGNEIGWSVKATQDSGFIVAGTTNSSGRAKGFVFKTNKSGTILWSTELNSDSIADIYNVYLSKFGGIYAIGYASTDSNGSDMFVAKLNSSGAVQWGRRYGSPGDEEAYSIAEDDKGFLAVVGVTNYDSTTEGARNSQLGDQDIAVAIIDSFGNLKVMKNYGSVDIETAWDIKPYGRDQYAIVGWTRNFPFGSNDAFVMFIDTVGNYKTVYGYGTGGDDRIFDVEVNVDGGLILSGYLQQNGGDRDVMVLNINSNGNLINYSILGGFDDDGHWPTDAIRTRDGGFAVISTAKSFRKNKGTDFYLIRTTDRLASACNDKIELINVTQASFNSYNFGTTRFYYESTTPLFSTATANSFDSTLCCLLEARVAADSIRLCESKSVKIGKEAISGYVYSWTADNSKFTSSEASPNVSPSTTTKYKLVVSSADKVCKTDSAYVVVQVFSTIKADLVRDTTFCSGDTVSISAYSGMAGYLWIGNTVQANTQTIRMAQTDTVYLTAQDNNGCSYSDTLKTLKNQLPIFDLGRDTTICENLPITLSGPVNMKSYNWNNGEANSRVLVTKTEKRHFLHVVDNNGCIYDDSIQIFSKPFSTFTLGADTSFCNNGSFTILGPGALSGYIWNGKANPNQNFVTNIPGTYTLTAFNSFSCPFSDTIVLTHKPAPAFDLGDSIYLCLGATKTLSGPDNMLAYKWSNGPITKTQDITFSGRYNLKVTDSAGCSYTDTIVMVQKFPPVIDLGNDTTICIGDSILLDAGAGYNVYSWNNGKSTRTIYASLEFKYVVQVTDKFGCLGTDEKQVDTMTCNTGSVNLPKGMSATVYPNPSKGVVYLTLNGNRFGNWEYTITDINGKIVEANAQPIQMLNETISFNLNNQSKGIYFIRLYSANGSANFKVILE
jgi:hypothetical protein